MDWDLFDWLYLVGAIGIFIYFASNKSYMNELHSESVLKKVSGFVIGLALFVWGIALNSLGGIWGLWIMLLSLYSIIFGSTRHDRSKDSIK